MTNETKARSLAKTLAYRVVAVVLLAAVTYVFTGNPGETTVVTLVFNAGGTAAYYGLERLWDGIDWGKAGSRPPMGSLEGQAIKQLSSVRGLQGEGKGAVQGPSLVSGEGN